MYYMLKGRTFNQDVSNWDLLSYQHDRLFMTVFCLIQDNIITSSVRNMHGMFDRALVFNQDISG